MLIGVQILMIEDLLVVIMCFQVPILSLGPPRSNTLFPDHLLSLSIEPLFQLKNLNPPLIRFLFCTLITKVLRLWPVTPNIMLVLNTLSQTFISSESILLISNFQLLMSLVQSNQQMFLLSLSVLINLLTYTVSLMYFHDLKLEGGC